MFIKKNEGPPITVVLNSSPHHDPPLCTICVSYHFRRLLNSTISALQSELHRIIHHDSCSKGAYPCILYVTLDHKTSRKSLRYICSNSQKYTVWVKILHFYFMQKIIRILSKECSVKIFCKCITVNIYKNVILISNMHC